MTNPPIELFRLKAATDFVREGLSLSVGDVVLRSEDNTTLCVAGWSRSPALEMVTQQSALDELSEVIDIYNKMMKMCPNLLELAEKNQVAFSLSLDYGKMGEIKICSMKNSVVTWDVNLKS